MASWVAEHWFDLIQTVGIIGGFLFTSHTIRKDERARQISNLIALNERHDYIWSSFYEQPTLGRIRRKDIDLRADPISDIEFQFTKTLFLHLDTSRRAAKARMLREPAGLAQDVRHFMSFPIPRAVWERIQPFQEADFIKFVEDALGPEFTPKGEVSES